MCFSYSKNNHIILSLSALSVSSAHSVRVIERILCKVRYISSHVGCCFRSQRHHLLKLTPNCLLFLFWSHPILFIIYFRLISNSQTSRHRGFITYVSTPMSGNSFCGGKGPTLILQRSELPPLLP